MSHQRQQVAVTLHPELANALAELAAARQETVEELASRLLTGEMHEMYCRGHIPPELITDRQVWHTIGNVNNL